jgi:uncharacterized protein
MTLRSSGVTNLEVVQGLFESVERRDAEAFARAFDPGVTVHEAPSLPYGGGYRGMEGVARHAQAYTAAWDALQGDGERRLDPEFLADGDRVIVLWRQRARHPETGKGFDAPVVSVYRLREGKVVESRMFHFDAAATRDYLASVGASRS